MLLTSVKSNPKHAASWVALAKIRQRVGNYDEAVKCYINAINGDPKSYVALQAYGVLEYQYKNIDNARELFRKAIEVSPRSIHALQAWATLERKEGNYHNTTISCNDTITITLTPLPTSITLTLTLTLTLTATGNLDAAERLLIRAQNIYPDSTRIRLSYAEICELRGESKKVRDIFVTGNP